MLYTLEFWPSAPLTGFHALVPREGVGACASMRSSRGSRGSRDEDVEPLSKREMKRMVAHYTKEAKKLAVAEKKEAKPWWDIFSGGRSAK